jgi:FAD/FMN-containing dehydrogenase
MSKVANYLNEHILGEVTTNTAVRQALSTDASVLTMTPEMVVYPRTTNDIRKVARFSNQLAEKGHILPITTRGAGSDQTGAAIGKGIILNTTAHMNDIFEIDVKQRLVRVQPGVTFKALNDALKLHGMIIPAYPLSASYSTIGGAIANNATGIYSGKYGSTGQWVHQLEVVLSNGDIIQTGRVSKRDLNRMKGQQTFEGEIYRQIDNLITDNGDYLAQSIDTDVYDGAGYNGIATVKQKDGSIDLAPLIIGSQGTLGIISEIIMKTTFINQLQMSAIAFSSWEDARDALEAIASFEPAVMELIDGQLYETALEKGKKYAFYNEALDFGAVQAVVIVGFDDSSERRRNKKTKKLRKMLEQTNTFIKTAQSSSDCDELLGLKDVSTVTMLPDDTAEAAPPLVDGAYIPQARFEDFMSSLTLLGEKYNLKVPVYGRVIDSVYNVRPAFQLHKVTDKQKIVKFTDEYARLVSSHGGHLIGESGEGRYKALFARKEYDDELEAIYQAVRDAFDPLGIMNTGVKQTADLKTLVSHLRKSYDLAAFANHSPTN